MSRSTVVFPSTPPPLSPSYTEKPYTFPENMDIPSTKVTYDFPKKTVQRIDND